MKNDLQEYFPDCEIHFMQQRSPAWHEIRRGKITASSIGPWITEEPECRMTVNEIREELDKLGVQYLKSGKKEDLLAELPENMQVKSLTQATEKAKEKAICSLLGSFSKYQAPEGIQVDPDGPVPTNPMLYAIWNGIVLEPEACAQFSFATDLSVVEVGFCVHKGGVAGCSPDRLIDGLPEGLEIKCPSPSTHIGYLRAGVLPEQYVDQVHFSMAVTGAQAWWFQSYVPDLPTFRIRVERDEYTAKMLRGIERFTAEAEAATMKLKRDMKRNAL